MEKVNFKKVIMIRVLICLLLCFGLPLSSLAQFADKGKRVEVVKGTRLCSNVDMEKAKGVVDPGRVFWKVTSKIRTNGTQTVAAFIYETQYDRLSGDSKTKESKYDSDYAVHFARVPDHDGMIFLVSPKDGRIEATVEVCRKEK